MISVVCSIFFDELALAAMLENDTGILLRRQQNSESVYAFKVLESFKSTKIGLCFSASNKSVFSALKDNKGLNSIISAIIYFVLIYDCQVIKPPYRDTF